jgi:hypothetical protein
MNKKNRPALFLLRRGGVIEHEKQFNKQDVCICCICMSILSTYMRTKINDHLSAL